MVTSILEEPITLISSIEVILKMEPVCSSEVLVLTYKSTQCFNPEDQSRYEINVTVMLNILLKLLWYKSNVNIKE